MLIVLSAEDRTQARVEKLLRGRGVVFERLDPVPLIASKRLQLSWDGAASTIAVDGRAIDLSAVQSVWLWRPTPTPYLGEPSDEATRIQSYIVREFSAVLSSLWRSMHARWVPAQQATISRAEDRPLQLSIARRAGFRVPQSLVTNSVDDAIRFLERIGGSVITKAPSDTIARHFTTQMFPFTTSLRACDLASLDTIRHAPVLLQEQIPKSAELRVTVVGDRVLAARIDSQSTHHTKDDWRRYDLAHTPHSPCDLPARVANACLRVARDLDLRYGAIDLILTPAGEYVFLEINPNGQFGWIEDRTGLPIGAALCDELLGDRGTGSNYGADGVATA
jgi:glutathione synthase/RimK-type ligase-like ATP-grasp enzyme